MILVIGGGVIGAAVARVAARSEPVMVASLTPRQHAGLWFRFNIAKDPLPADLPREARIVVAIGGAEQRATQALIARASRGVIVVQAGVGPPTPGAASVRTSPAWDLHERSLQPILDAMRRGGTGRLPRGLPLRKWIWAEDVARVALDLRGQEQVELQGPLALDGAGVAAALAARERGICGVSWFRSVSVPPDPERDDWDDARWGQRRRL